MKPSGASKGQTEASQAQHFDLPKGQPAQFTYNGELRTCQCSDCLRKAPSSVSTPAQDVSALHDEPRCDCGHLFEICVREALKPFYKASEYFSRGKHKNHHPLFAETGLTVGDLRLLLAALSASGPQADGVRKALETAQMALADGLPNAKVNPALLLIEAALLSTPSASAGPQAEAVAWHYRIQYDDGSWSNWLACKKTMHDTYRAMGRIGKCPTETRELYAHPQPQQADGRGGQLRDPKDSLSAFTVLKERFPEALGAIERGEFTELLPLGDSRRTVSADGRGAVIEALNAARPEIVRQHDRCNSDEEVAYFDGILAKIDAALQQSLATDGPAK